MHQYVNVLIYILIGLVGASLHFLKKRYVDNTTTQSFWSYLTDHKQSTFQTIALIISAEYGLSLAHESGILSLSELVGALTAGYSADSGLNKTFGGDNDQSR